MKRILALIGLIMIGAMLLADPNTGVVAVVEEAAASTTAEATTTTAPPDPGTGDSDTTIDQTEESSTTPTSMEETSVAEATSDGTYTGEAVGSKFGDFQVQIIVEDGVMTSITTLREPGDRKSERINSTAIPYYTEQALQLQASDFDALSGATVTWRSWGASLESAMELAGLA